MFRKLKENRARRKARRAEQKAEQAARRERLSKYSFGDFTIGRLREYPETLELVQTVIDQGATHFWHDPRWDDTSQFYRMSGEILEYCTVKDAFSKRPRLIPWADLRPHLIDQLETMQEQIKAEKGEQLRGLTETNLQAYLQFEEELKKYLSSPSTYLLKESAIEEIFESDESSDITGSGQDPLNG